MAAIVIIEQRAHGRMSEHFMENGLFNLGRAAVVVLHDIYRVVIEQTRRHRFAVLRRRTSENGPWQISECLDFLNAHRQHAAELPGESVSDMRDSAVQLGAAGGRMYFLFDGVRVVCLGTCEYGVTRLWDTGGTQSGKQ